MSGQSDTMSTPEADPDGLLVFVRALHREAGADFAAALATLSTLLTNVLESPEDPKFRSVRLGNATFHRRLGRFAAALPLLRKFGFEDRQQQDAQAVTHLVLPVADAAHLARCHHLGRLLRRLEQHQAAGEAGVFVGRVLPRVGRRACHGKGSFEKVGEGLRRFEKLLLHRAARA